MKHETLDLSVRFLAALGGHEQVIARLTFELRPPSLTDEQADAVGAAIFGPAWGTAK